MENSSPPTAEPASLSSTILKIAVTILKYIGFYLLGILICVLLTPVEFELAGRLLLPFYLSHSLYGYVIWVFLSGQTSLSVFVWLIWLIFFMPFFGGAFAFFSRSARFRSWHPFWIAFPIGFVGTAALYIAGMLSV